MRERLNMAQHARNMLAAGVGWAGADLAVNAIAEPMRDLPPRIDQHKAQLQQIERMRWALGKSTGTNCIKIIWEDLQLGLPAEEVYAQQRSVHPRLCPGDDATLKTIVDATEHLRVVHTLVNGAISDGEQAESYLKYVDSPGDMLRIITAGATGLLGAVVVGGAVHSRQEQPT